MEMKATIEEKNQTAQRRQALIQEFQMERLSDALLIEFLGDADWDILQAAQGVLFDRGKAALTALIAGLSHADGRVRGMCAGLMDHLGDDRCFEPLCAALKSDRLESVRRQALHALACQGCKECPLSGDTLLPLMDAALNDRSLAVRRRAVQYLVGQKRDARVVTMAKTLLAQEKDGILRLRAERALSAHQG